MKKFKVKGVIMVEFEREVKAPTWADALTKLECSPTDQLIHIDMKRNAVNLGDKVTIDTKVRHTCVPSLIRKMGFDDPAPTKGDDTR